MSLVGFTNPAAAAEEEGVYTYLETDRLEFQEHADALLWDMQGWAGGDYRKLWLKTEGDREHGVTRNAEVQLLYSRAVSPWFDLQLGVRHDFLPHPSRSFAVAGLQGLAPWWFEIDAAAFLSDDGDLSARIEVEYELVFTQRLILQPRVEINLAAQEVPELGLGKGISSTDVGLRLRYELHRKVAPYVGVTWQKYLGDTAEFREAAGEDDDTVTLVAGLRFWF